MLTKNSLFISLLTISSLTSLGYAEVKTKSPKSSEKQETKKADHGLYSESQLKGKFVSWGIDPNYKTSSINLEPTWKKFKKNKDIVVAVIDTGIQHNHPFLKDNIFVINGKAGNSNYGMDFSGKSASPTPTDSHGHGTHVSGIIKSIFPEVKLLSLKYYNPQASGQKNLESTIQALKYAVDNNVDIINYSGGGPEASAAELSILKQAEEKGILVIAAAGNEKSNIDLKKNAYYPASYGLSNIVTVGAHDEYNQVISSSNWGRKSVDIAAPGYRIKSAIPGSGAGLMTGTSQATAFVTGVAALIKSKFPKLNFQQVKNIILSSSLKVSKLKGKVLGGGKLDALRAIEVAEHVNTKLFGLKRTVAKKNN
ncbi:MAG: serine protease [Halobacteriovoraceae bacterium]|nr:serine protease [Halobacteriovoraceae bacterium]|tara:strand:+ start:965 stop:2065 length:1101 start_codon:yes stop_codon:yes gene_type:complete